MIGLDRGRNPKQRTALLATAGALATGAAGLWAWRKFSPELAVAPGWPGKTPYWSSSAKQAIGTAIGCESPVWFTVHRGALTEIFFPRVDQPSIRRLGMIVTGPRGYYSDEKQHADHELRYLAEGVPAFQIVTTCREGRYRLEKTLFAHPSQPAVLQAVRFTALRGRLQDYRLHVLVEPHLDNAGWRNTASVGNHKGRRLLLARRAGHSVAVGASLGWRKASAGFHGVSDGLAQLAQYGELRQCYRRAPRGAVALIGELDLDETRNEFLLVAGFGESAAEAGHRVGCGLLSDWRELLNEYVEQWQAWHDRLPRHEPPEPGGRDLYRASTMVLRAHADKRVPGAAVASLSTPWGEARATNSHTGPVGYHVVWARDLSMIAGGMLAAGDREYARRTLDYLRATQEEHGNWAQNQNVNGQPIWTGRQLGQNALPIMLFELLNRDGALTAADRAGYWPMVRAAAGIMLRHGPSAHEDRWEDAEGYTPFSLGAMTVCLLFAAELADERGENELATYLRESADAWCGSLEHWTYVRDTDLARRIGVEGYYLRVAPPDGDGAPLKYRGHAEYWYRSPSFTESKTPADVVSVDALVYVRFGLRAPDDARILDTIKVIDALLRVETPRGPCWRRYHGDGYGEQADGSPFDNKRGIGRLWPLLTGERAHYELLAGRPDEAARLLGAMEQFAGDGDLLPEQVWDTEAIPARGLFIGRPNGSAMPLAWAHAEYLKLRRSLADGRVFDLPALAWRRYVVEKTTSPHVIWGVNHHCRQMPVGKTLRIHAASPTTISWRADGQAGGTVRTRDTGLGMHYADLPTADFPSGSVLRFRFERPQRRLIGKRHWFASSGEVTIQAESGAPLEASRSEG